MADGSAPDHPPGGAPRAAWALVLGTLLVVAGVDHATGPELGFYVFYFLPVGLAAWWLGRRAAVALALASAVAWFAIDVWAGHVYSSELFRAWNTLVRLTSFLVLGLVLAATRDALARAQALNAQLSQALAEVRRVSGLLPICAACKSIRNDEGYWERVEKFIADRSEADFTHSICPACEARLYPDRGEPG